LFYFRRILYLPIILLLLLQACESPKTGSQGKASEAASEPMVSLTIFAASLFSGPLNDIGAAYHDTHPNVTIAVLEEQLADGVPSDIFVSGDQTNMEKASKVNLVSASRVFAKNKLVVIVSASNVAQIHTLKDLANKGVKIAVAASAVSVGKDSLQMLDNLSKLPDYGVKYVNGVRDNIVALEDNAHNVAQKVQAGTVDAGIVYATDLTTLEENRLIDIPIPDQVNLIVEYPIAVTKSSQHGNDAQAFVEYILSAQGQNILKKYNFLPSAA
jgi:molybdate transport system substrate-binding protein